MAVAVVTQLHVQTAVEEIVADEDLGIRRVSVPHRVEVALEVAMEAIGGEHPQIIVAVVADNPFVVQHMAGLDGVTLGNAIEVELVIDMEHGACEAGVGKQQPDLVLAGIDMRTGVQDVGKRAREPHAGLLKQRLRCRRRSGSRQCPLVGIRCGPVALVGQLREAGIVGAREVEGRGEVA